MTPEEKAIYNKEYRAKNKEKIAAVKKIWQTQNKDKVNAAGKAWYARNKETRRKTMDAWREKNIERHKAMTKEWALKNRDTINAKTRERIKTDAQFRLTRSLRFRLWEALRAVNASKCISSSKLIGMPMPEFKTYIESKFTDGMSWDNKGEWHLDHIKPCAAFDLTNIEQQKECFHWSNFQPLWGKDNVSKNSFYEGKRHRYKESALNSR